MPNFSDITVHTQRCTLRSWCMDDASRLSSIANTRDISWNTSYKFPYPFDSQAAQRFIMFNTTDTGNGTWQFAVQLDGTLVGGCGAIRGTDVQSHTAIIGYWLGVEYWGQGIATEILGALVTYMHDETDIEQLSATGYGWNPASERVLIKNGFIKEGVRKGVVKKWDKTTDLWIYGKLLR